MRIQVGAASVVSASSRTDVKPMAVGAVDGAVSRDQCGGVKGDILLASKK
jgi:hypothetical protein